MSMDPCEVPDAGEPQLSSNCLRKVLCYSVRPRTTQYVPVRQLTGTRTGRYRAVLPKGDHRRSIEEKSRREEEEEMKKEAKEKRYLEPSSPACHRRPHVVATRGSPTSRRRHSRPQVARG
ncbi:hypothetical protein BHM03_00058584 [Ensete ventricosum]|nr:hypothetical protein BHM03_00058584 [Ensete ventricosum]